MDGMDDDRIGSAIEAAELVVWEVMGAAGGALLGGALGPGGSLVGGVVGQQIANSVGTEVLAYRRARAARMFEVALNASEVSPAELGMDLMSTEARIQLTASAIEAAMRAVADEKIVVLGRLLAEGRLHEDDAVLSVDLPLARALADIEAPHLQLLDRLYDKKLREPGGTRAEIGFSIAHLRGRTTRAQRDGSGFPQFADGMDALLGTLQVHGLARWAPPDWSDVIGQGSIPAPRPSKWYITTFGILLHERIVSAGMEFIDP